MSMFGGAFVVGPLEVVGFAHERRDRQPLAFEALELPGAAPANVRSRGPFGSGWYSAPSQRLGIDVTK
jgi:hypothetical protein